MSNLYATANHDGLTIQRGLSSKISIVHKFGFNLTVPNGTWEGVLALSSAFPWLTAATTVRIKAGGDAADAAAGAGMRTCTVQGLDATGVAVEEDITCNANGTLASGSTTQSFLRVFRTFAKTVGAYTVSNTAAVTIENTAGNTDLINIPAGFGQSQYCGYTIPLGKTGYLMSALVQADASKACDFRLMTRNDILTVAAPFAPARCRFYWDGVLGPSTLSPQSAVIIMPALSDVWIEAKGGGAGTEVAADMEIYLIDS